MKKFLVCFLIFYFQKFYSQQGMYRLFPQTQSNFGKDEMNIPIKTSDNGYIFSSFRWTAGIHGPSPVYQFTLKTDSNFIPQWKKPYCASPISLPTGGIIICYYNVIEKITVSGAVVWVKNISDNSLNLNDGVTYTNKIRFVGRKAGDTGYPNYLPTSQPYSLEIDTLGNIISQTLFNPSYGGDADFSKIKRDNQGNFFVYSTPNGTSPSYMSLAKFNSTFNLIWAKKWSQTNQMLLIRDLDILANGRIFASGEVILNYPNIFMNMGALLKFDSQGNLVQQKYFDGSFRWNGSGNYQISGLCKKPNGNYIVSEERTFLDSIIMFETDTAMNVVWNKFIARGTGVGTSIIKNANIYTPIFKFTGPILLSTNLSGAGCSSYSAPYTQLTSSVAITNFSLTPSLISATLITGVSSPTFSQSYIDSCICPVSIQNYQSSLCVGQSSTINIIGTGQLSWYATATGNSFIQPGSQYIYASTTPTTKIIYAQDSICTLNPIRTPITITVFPSPTISFSPPNPTICPGNQILLSVNGAVNYTWSCNSLNTSVQSLNPLVTTNYTVTGSLASGCIDTKTISLIVIPTLTISSNPSVVCQGNQATITAIGANSYTWANGSTNSLIILNPNQGISTYSVIGQAGNCIGVGNFSLLTSSLPNINITCSSSLICVNDSITLFANGANSYTWSNNLSSNSISVMPNTNVNYSVTGSNAYLCYNTSSISIMPLPIPTLTIFSTNSIICVGENVTISVSGANTYTWNNSITSNSIFISPIANSSLIVIGENNYGCKSTANYVQIVDACEKLNEFPAFDRLISITPNPSSGKFLISFKNGNEHRVINIFNTLGINVYSIETNSQTCETNLNGLINGVYEIRVIEKTLEFTAKLIKVE